MDQATDLELRVHHAPQRHRRAIVQRHHTVPCFPVDYRRLQIQGVGPLESCVLSRSVKADRGVEPGATERLNPGPSCRVNCI